MDIKYLQNYINECEIACDEYYKVLVRLSKFYVSKIDGEEYAEDNAEDRKLAEEYLYNECQKLKDTAKKDLANFLFYLALAEEEIDQEELYEIEVATGMMLKGDYEKYFVKKGLRSEKYLNELPQLLEDLTSVSNVQLLDEKKLPCSIGGGAELIMVYKQFAIKSILHNGRLSERKLLYADRYLSKLKRRYLRGSKDPIWAENELSRLGDIYISRKELKASNSFPAPKKR